jgi:hypothetical protein
VLLVAVGIAIIEPSISAGRIHDSRGFDRGMFGGVGGVPSTGFGSSSTTR